MNTRTLRLLAVLSSIMILALLAACSSSPATSAPTTVPSVPTTAPSVDSTPVVTAEQPKLGGIAQMVLRRDPPGAWDIMRVTQRYDLNTAGAPIFGAGNLVRECRDDVYTVCPGLADSWQPNNDFTEWTFHIRPNVKFHDGVVFTADHAKFWIDLIAFGAESGGKTRLPAWWKATFGDVQQVDVLPGDRLRITLGTPAPRYVEIISSPFWNLALPQHLIQPLIQAGKVDATPEDVGYVSVGPFKMLSNERGSRVRVRRFDEYWEKDAQGTQLPYLDGIDFSVITDPSAFDAAFRSGRLDGGARVGGYTLNTERQASYESSMGDKVWFARIASGGGISLGLNLNLLKEGPLQDIRVRRAIALWVDKEASIAAFQGNEGYVASIMAPANPFSSPDFMTWPGYDPKTRVADRAEAKQLMVEAGYGDGFALTYPCQSSYLDRCQFFQAQLAELGIDLQFTVLDPTAWSAANLSLDYDMFQASACGAAAPEAQEPCLTNFSISKGTAAKQEDPKIPEFFKNLNAATDDAERLKIWRQLEKYMVADQIYMIPISGRWTITPYRDHLKGLPVPAQNPMSLLTFATVWLDK